MEIKVGEYKGHTLLVFDNGDRYPVSLGISKLCTVVDNIDAVLNFLEEHGGERGQETIEKYRNARIA